MSSFLERYERGEYEQVWDELVALGAAVREEPLAADARAVAFETMRRARHNVDALIPQLVGIGFLFGYAYLQPPRGQPFGWEAQAWYYKSLQWTLHQPPLRGSSAVQSEQEAADARGRLERLRQLKAPPGLLAYNQQRAAELEAAPTKLVATLDAFEHEIAPLPLSVRAWYEVVGAVNFVGLHVGWLRLLDPADEDAQEREAMVRGDVGIPLHRLAGLEPLCVPPFAASRATQHATRPGVWRYEFMPDRWSVYGDTGQPNPSAIDLPCPAADVILPYVGRESMTFVSYLRECFRWGGFPGWKRAGGHPERDLALLTHGLLPL